MGQTDEMSTVSQVMEKLRMNKADNEFRWTEQGFTAGKGKFYHTDDLEIVKTYRFEGASDPADTAILYIIRANDGLLGYSLDAYGAYSNHDDAGAYDNFIRKVPQTDHDQQLLFEL